MYRVTTSMARPRRSFPPRSPRTHALRQRQDIQDDGQGTSLVSPAVADRVRLQIARGDLEDRDDFAAAEVAIFVLIPHQNRSHWVVALETRDQVDHSFNLHRDLLPAAPRPRQSRRRLRGRRRVTSK